jgi:hypothetical protein
MGKQFAEKVAIVAVSDEAAARIAQEHGLETDDDWARVTDAADVIAASAGVTGALREMAFDNDELADPACRAMIDALSRAGWTNHLKPSQRL